MIKELNGQVPEAETVKSLNIEHEINNYRTQLKEININDINDQKYDYQMGVNYMDIIGDCEKLGDYVINVVEAQKAHRLVFVCRIQLKGWLNLPSLFLLSASYVFWISIEGPLVRFSLPAFSLSYDKYFADR